MDGVGGKYYTRSKKVNGRVVREYVGAGPFAELLAKFDVLEREERKLFAERIREEKQDLDDLDAAIKNSFDTIEQVVRAALIAAGYRRHHRGEWRKRREQS